MGSDCEHRNRPQGKILLSLSFLPLALKWVCDLSELGGPLCDLIKLARRLFKSRMMKHTVVCQFFTTPYQRCLHRHHHRYRLRWQLLDLRTDDDPSLHRMPMTSSASCSLQLVEECDGASTCHLRGQQDGLRGLTMIDRLLVRQPGHSHSPTPTILAHPLLVMLLLRDPAVGRPRVWNYAFGLYVPNSFRFPTHRQRRRPGSLVE